MVDKDLPGCLLIMVRNKVLNCREMGGSWGCGAVDIDSIREKSISREDGLWGCG